MSHFGSACWYPSVSQPSWLQFLFRRKVTINDLPENILLEILSLVPRKDLILNCRLVCSQWRDLVDLPVLWKRKCHRMGFCPEGSYGAFQDWRTFYFDSIRGNLVKNPCGEEGLKYWEVNGTHWEITDETVLDHRFCIYENCPRIPHLPQNIQKFFIFICPRGSPIQIGYKKQRISLWEEGYSGQLMDVTKPKIRVEDWHYPGNRSTCILYVKLLSSSFGVLRECSLTSTFIDARNKVSHTFANYPCGVRYIELQHEVQTGSAVKITRTNIMIDEERTPTAPLSSTSLFCCHS